MDSSEVRFKHVGLSSDGAVIFCAMDNGIAYAMPLHALEQAEDWNPKAKPTAAGIIHDGYAAMVGFDTGTEIDFPSEFVLQVCEPSHSNYKARSMSGVGGRIREIRMARRMTLDALAVKSGIAKPNLSRLEHDKVTPTFETLKTIAAALDTHPVLLVAAKKPNHAWTWTRHQFTEWKLGLRWQAAVLGSHPENVRGVDLVKVFLATRPEHRYARMQLLKHFDPRPEGRDLPKYTVDAEKWTKEATAAETARKRINRVRQATVKPE